MKEKPPFRHVISIPFLWLALLYTKCLGGSVVNMSRTGQANQPLAQLQYPEPRSRRTTKERYWFMGSGRLENIPTWLVSPSSIGLWMGGACLFNPAII